MLVIDVHGLRAETSVFLSTDPPSIDNTSILDIEGEIGGINENTFDNRPIKRNITESSRIEPARSLSAASLDIGDLRVISAKVASARRRLTRDPVRDDHCHSREQWRTHRDGCFPRSFCEGYAKR